MSKPLWRGPWIGKTPVVPTTGTFVLFPTSVVSSTWTLVQGTVLGALLPGAPPNDSIIRVNASSTGLVRCLLDPDTALYLNGDGTPTKVSDLPVGFTITAADLDIVHAGTGDLWGQFSEAHEVAYNFGGMPYPASPLPSMADLCAEGIGARGDSGPGELVQIGTFANGGLFIYGTYEY